MENQKKKPRTHFVRILDTSQVRSLVRMLEAAADRSFPVDLKAETFKIHAPDGDMVFAGLKHPSGKWLCRLHREVFDERVQA